LEVADPLDPETLLQAYAMGIFPMAEGREDPEIHWVDPRRRGVIPLDGFHLSRSLARTLRRTPLTVTVDRAFDAVVSACAERAETWISHRIQHLYGQLHRRGFAHSIEVRDGDALVGGVYGVTLGGAFFGESMFSRVTDASKIALAHAVHRLRAGGFQLFDTQFLTPHLASLGAVEITRADYHRRLTSALAVPANFFPPGYSPSTASVVEASGRMQDSTHTS
jgi:leucyl/phenylalanyl-tRNA--protein transferase